MNDLPLGALFAALVFLLLLSAFFSGSETALMTLNRYRLRHLAEAGHPGARLAERLLAKPDRLIGLILLGNNFVNILASSLATIVAIRIGGEGAIAAAAGLLTLVVLIFSEVAPKTMAALNPERVAFPASWVYTPLLRLMFPLVWLVNLMANAVLRALGVHGDDAEGTALSREELRTVVNEAGAMIPKRHQKMLINILDLEKITVDDIMVPRNEIDGVDLDNPLDVILEQLEQTPYTRVLVFHGSVDHVAGFLHARRVMKAQLDGELTRETLDALIREPYFIPKGTPLNRQLINFQRNRRRTALVVDEYGDVQGLVTMADLLEEIVGEFATDPADAIADVLPQEDGSFLVDGGANLRELVRTMHWDLPTDGPKTINGLIVEHLESIPEPGTTVLIAGYPVEIVQTQDNAVKTARIRPDERRDPAA
ncbi:MAG: HlyC/CorC family transporter [Chromatiaceae bacterium]|nr:HlyC/CorC family transporter [Gammaproteobacteria bacterium]MCP5301159.1 HlyC/CorC family transporter [Chromatiaceae bacterium]MCP5421369.1 HlyC/CorC family transporter [Chromatiaceae bacterium]